MPDRDEMLYKIMRTYELLPLTIFLRSFLGSFPNIIVTYYGSFIPPKFATFVIPATFLWTFSSHSLDAEIRFSLLHYGFPSRYSALAKDWPVRVVAACAASSSGCRESKGSSTEMCACCVRNAPPQDHPSSRAASWGGLRHRFVFTHLQTLESEL